MKYTWSLILAGTIVSACGSGDRSVPDGPAPLEIPMRIVVTDGSVEVYMGAADLGTCGCNAVTFPDVGTCSFLTDANPCDFSPNCHSCITDFAVELDGTRLVPTAYGGTDPWAQYYGAFSAGQLSLVLAGCGHPTTRISLDGSAFPHATATADYIGTTPHVSWTSDEPSPSTLLTFYGGPHGELCNVQGVSDFTFTGWDGGATVRVEVLGSRADVVSAFGPATIWRGGAAAATFPPLP